MPDETQDELSDLIAELEKAKAPDRELDARIGRVVFGWRVGCDRNFATDTHDGWGALSHETDILPRALPRFTAGQSVDALMPLDITQYTLGYCVGPRPEIANTACIWRKRSMHEAAAPTLGLAHCIAALKARKGAANAS